MILVDANLLLYAEDSLSEHHEAARRWWDEQLSASEPVGLSWPSLTAFIRIGTNARLLRRPLSLVEAIARVQSWLEQPCVRLLLPSDHHWEILRRMLREGKAAGPMVTDAHLAALAIEHGCVLQSTDRDFARFPELAWENPLIPT